RKPSVTPEKLARAQALVASGLTVREAAGRLKVGKTALYEALASAKAVNRRQDGAPWRHEERVPGSVQRHCCLQSMVEHFSCWAGPVKPEAAVGGGPKGLA
ncbi:MAG: hypothetical protein WA970_19050, partial [Gammaproteobacteria bacterium]